MIVGKEVVNDIVSLLKREIAFAAYSLPEEDAISFVIDDGVSPLLSSRKFIINTWDGAKIRVLDRISISQANAYPIDVKLQSHIQREETSRDEYKSGIERVTNMLQSIDGKVVVSRIKMLENSRIDYALVAESAIEMFAIHKKAFRAIYFTPSTGAWCVCSPELLLNIDKKSGALSTVALAGTRRGDIIGEWDNKNAREHNYVVCHIADTLRMLGISPEIQQSETMTVGNIQHILTRIRGRLANVEGVAIEEIVDALHPTPAICGYPVEWAKGIINEVEHHDRECYGGYIAIDDDRQFLAHVNLRSFSFEPGSCCFWGGGGIMKDSTATSEWNESEMKIESTLSFIRKRLDK